jgi:glycosyltransferase involved in cell wall biosynthesis
VVWSDRQGDLYAEELGIERRCFTTVRYKSNHSKEAPLALSSSGYVFAGGNSERDYSTLFRAVDDLPVPVIVATTNPIHATVPRNVVLVRAQEPHFARLMAAARIVVIPLTANRLRAAGESSYLSAMWHGRPVIVADDVSAPEYLEHGVDALVVPPSDPLALRHAIDCLLGDPEQAEEIGRRGQARVRSEYTHGQYVARMLGVAAARPQSTSAPLRSPLRPHRGT